MMKHYMDMFMQDITVKLIISESVGKGVKYKKQGYHSTDTVRVISFLFGIILRFLLH